MQFRKKKIDLESNKITQKEFIEQASRWILILANQF